MGQLQTCDQAANQELQLRILTYRGLMRPLEIRGSIALEAQGSLLALRGLLQSAARRLLDFASMRNPRGETNSAKLKHQISIANSWQKMVRFRQSRTRLSFTCTIRVHAMKHGKRTAHDLRKPHVQRRRKPEPRAIVQCEHFRCVGLQNADGRWVGLGGEDLNVLEVITWVKR